MGSVYHFRIYSILLTTHQWNITLECKHHNFSFLFIAVSPKPRSVPATQKELSKYSLNE